jgi:hypothetical protein
VVPLLAGVEQRLEESFAGLTLDDGDATARGRQCVPRRLHCARHQVPHRVHQRTRHHRVRVCVKPARQLLSHPTFHQHPSILMEDISRIHHFSTVFIDTGHGSQLLNYLTKKKP